MNFLDLAISRNMLSQINAYNNFDLCEIIFLQRP